MVKEIATFLLVFSFLTNAYPRTSGVPNNDWVYRLLSFRKLNASIPKEPLVIAIVDDGFRLSHVSLKKYIHINKKEKVGNLTDDDRNGYVDDVEGWDISDDDPDVSLPPGKERTFYHGTYLASIIIEAFERSFGPEAYRYVQILPVKALSDQSKNTYLADGYKGIQYAIGNGAQLICCAWSGGTLSAENRKILEEAHKKNVIVVGSAGNFSMEKIEAPAYFPHSIAIAAIDESMRKLKESNFGMRVDFSCPGKNILGASSLNDTSYSSRDGTSPATALATSCLGILKVLFPDKNLGTWTEALTNTAKPVDNINAKYTGKLGAGTPQLDAAYHFLSQPIPKRNSYTTFRTKETLYLGSSCSPLISIAPHGHFKSIRMEAKDLKTGDLTKEVQLLLGDSVWFSGTFSDLSRGLTIPFDQVTIKSTKNGPKCVRLNYFVETIDSSRLYCEANRTLELEEGSIRDGSGTNDYANGCNCQWQISVPEGKRIKLFCDSLDTEPNMDFIWIFDGTATLPENLIAKFSGHSLPPVITSRSSQVLIWFVTNEKATGKGWSIRYQAVE